MSQYTCPVCHTELNPGLSQQDRKTFMCPNCKKLLQAEMRIVPYGIPLPSSGAVKAKFACPFCEQHYTIDQNWTRPILHCESCGNDFMTPDQLLEKLSAKPPAPPWAGKRKKSAGISKGKLPASYYIVLGALLAAVAAFSLLFLF